MTLDGSYDAAIDRIEDGTAVVLVEDAESGEVIEEVQYPAGELPAGVGAGAVVRVDIADGTLVEVEPRPEETERRREDAQSRFDRLSKRPDDEN